jgi:5-(carboxyamino)imidazole ribonucleotide synthase
MKKSQVLPLGKKIGILGGGQLARMLCLEGFKLGFEMHVLSSNADDPAAQVTRFWHQGDIENLENVQRFFEAVDVVTVESEFVNAAYLKEAQDTTTKSVFPTPDWLTKLSDRYSQKNWLQERKLPTAKFAHPQTGADAEHFFENHPKGVVFKKRRFGYDGYGTFIVRTQKELQNWLTEHSLNISEFIVEEFLPFRRELAVQITVAANKKALAFPLVQWQAQNQKCLWVKGPVKARGYDALIKKITQSLIVGRYVGTIAFEFFETSKGLVINEVAPRVHNSGHATLEATTPNQFGAHLMAIAGLDLPKAPALHTKGFAMYNLLGSSNDEPVIGNTDGVALHWYGKNENRPGRKIGHLTALASSADQALARVKLASKKLSL